MIKILEESLGRRAPRFAAGQLVRHRRYGYRGVVVALDERCGAPDEWYLNNQTQPDRSQAWYHVFVHDSTTVTYAAEENLQPDDDGGPIDHPFISKFFSAFEGGAYTRNDRAWPGWGT